MLVSRHESGFSVYWGEAGCPYCGTNACHTWIEANEGPITPQKAAEFVRQENINPAIVIPFDSMRCICEERTLAEALPDSIDAYTAVGPYPLKTNRVVREIIKAVKTEMEWPLVAADESAEANREHRSRAVSARWNERMSNEGWGSAATDSERGVRSSDGGAEWIFEFLQRLGESLDGLRLECDTIAG